MVVEPGYTRIQVIWNTHSRSRIIRSTLFLVNITNCYQISNYEWKCAADKQNQPRDI